MLFLQIVEIINTKSIDKLYNFYAFQSIFSQECIHLIITIEWWYSYCNLSDEKAESQKVK